jgi:hypothetical protein
MASAVLQALLSCIRHSAVHGSKKLVWGDLSDKLGWFMREVFDDNIFGVVVGGDISQNVGIRDHLKASWLKHADRKIYQSATGCYIEEFGGLQYFVTISSLARVWY